MNKLKFIGLILFFLLSSNLFSQTIIQMEKEGGVYKIPCYVNGLKLKMIFDTGASSICISQSVAEMMLENGYLSKDDIKGVGNSQVADGRIVDHATINLKTLKVGEITLSNIDAVVIMQQTAPLLFGQSAIKKLGNISINGDRLVINNGNISKKYTEDEISDMWDRAINYYYEENYELAIDLFEKIDQNNSMYGRDYYWYGSSLTCAGYYDRALSVLTLTLNNVDNWSNSLKRDYYFRMLIVNYELKNYNDAIKYGQMALLYEKFPRGIYSNIMYFICASHKDKGDEYRAINLYKDMINKYLKYMEISATDCWDKEYKDEFLAKVYGELAVLSSNGFKYAIIAAAWGNEREIEYMKEHNIDYTKNDYGYVY